MADPNKVFDVAGPGQSAPSDNARPIINTHKMLVRDPMMSASNENASEFKREEKPAQLTVPIIAKSISPPNGGGPAEEQEQTVENTTPIEPSKSEEEPKVEAKTGQPEEESVAETTPLSEPSTADFDNADNKEQKQGADKTAKEKAEIEKAAVKTKALDKLVVDKTYFVKIEQSKSQRSMIQIVIIVVAVLLFSFIALDLLIDAKIIKTSIPPVVDLIQN